MMELLRKESFNVPVPKKIKIGDPFYFNKIKEYEHFKGFEDDELLKQLTYDTSLRGKSKWIGKMEILIEKENTLEETRFLCVFAKNKKMANLLLENKIYEDQKINSKSIEISSASYIIEVNDKLLVFKTGADGDFGRIHEVFTGPIKVGIVIDMALSDLYSFEEHVRKLKFLFDLSLPEKSSIKENLSKLKILFNS